MRLEMGTVTVDDLPTRGADRYYLPEIYCRSQAEREALEAAMEELLSLNDLIENTYCPNEDWSTSWCVRGDRYDIAGNVHEFKQAYREAKRKIRKERKGK